MSETAISRLYVMLGLKSTIGADGQKAVSEANKTAVATGAALTAVGVAAKMAADNINRSYLSFESAMTEVRALGGVTKTEFESMRAAALDLSTEFPIAATAVADSMYLMISTGYEYTDMMSTIPSAAALATAGSMEMSEATNSLINVMGIYGDRAGDAAEISKVFANAVGVGKYEMGDFMTEMMKNIGSANQLNIAFSDLAAYNVALQNSFTSAEEAGTSFNAMLIKLTDPATVQTMEEMGVSISNTDGSLRDLTDIMADLQVALAGVNGDAERAAIVQQMFGTYGQRAALALMNQTDALPELKKEMRDLNLIEEQTATKLDGLAQRLEIADNKMEAAKITMGQAMAPATLMAADAMGVFAGILISVPEPLQALAGTGLTAAQSLIAIGPAVAGLVPAINAYRASTFAATVATQGFTAALMTSPVGLVAVGVTALAVALGGYYIATREADEATKDFNQTGMTALEQAKERIRVKQADIEGYRATVEWHRKMRDEAADLGGLLNQLSAQYHQSEIDKYTQKIADATDQLGGLNDALAKIEDKEIDIEMAESQHNVDTLESSLSQILRLMDEIEGKERTKAELEDTEAIREIRVRTSQKDLDEARAALKAWEKGGDNAYAIEFGSGAAREEHQRLIDEVTKAQVDLNRATREHEDTVAELAGLTEGYAAKENELLTVIAKLNEKYPDLALNLQDVAAGQAAVNEKVREYIAMTPAGMETHRLIDEFRGVAPEVPDTAPVAAPSSAFYGRGYASEGAVGFEAKEGGGLGRQPTDRTTTSPATTVAAQYAVEPLPAIQVEQPDPVIIDAKYREDPLPTLNVEPPSPVLLDARYAVEPLPAIQIEQPDPVIIDARYAIEPLPTIQIEQPDPVIIDARYAIEPLPTIQIEQPDPVIVDARYAVEPLPAIQIEQPDPVIIDARYAVEPLPAIQIEQPDPVIIDARYAVEPLPAIQIEQPDPVILDAMYAIEPLPAIQVEQPDPVIIDAMYAIKPIPSEVLASEEDLNKLREIRNTLDSDAIQANEEILKLYGEIEELLPELGDTHGTTVDEMIKELDEYIRQQEVAIANMQSLGGFEVKGNGGLVRQPTDRTTHPATPGDRETVEARYPPPPHMPVFEIKPIPSDVLISEEELNEIRSIRNELDSGAIQVTADLLALYDRVQEEIPEMGATHDLTVSGMVKKLDEYIKRQEAAIANMQTLGGVGSVIVSSATGGGQPERSAATGMPYVPRDMNVRVHEGEAIVPASETRSPRALHIHMHNPVVRDNTDIDLLTNALYRRLQRT